MIKVISLNIEGDNHYDRIFPFFRTESPDVLCLQEVYEVDLPLIEEKIGMQSVFLPISRVEAPNPFRKALKGVEGVAIFTKLPVLHSGSTYYESEPVDMSILDSKPEGSRRGLLWIDIEIEGKIYKIATTHFTWSFQGAVTDMQRADLKNLLEKTDELKPSLLCGDFNAPRGKEIFDTLAIHFTDNLPSGITTTIDQHLHRVPGIQFVVDGFFTREGYTASNVRVVDGVSDHCALVGNIEKQYD